MSINKKEDVMKKLLGIVVVLVAFVFMGFAMMNQDFKVVDRELSIEKKAVYVENEIIVTFEKGFCRTMSTELAGTFGLVKKEQKFYSDQFAVYKKGRAEGNIEDVMKRIKAVPGVASVERNGMAHAFIVPNDPYYYPYQWNMTRIGMESVWMMPDGSGVTVAVIDTGVRETLADFNRTDFVDGYDFVNSDNDPDDDNGHGSHVAGTIAQSTNNRIGVAGIAPGASIMPVKVLDAGGRGSYANIAAGIRWATDEGADVINLSLGGSYNSPVLENAINYAWNNGVVIVCAAGNNNVSTPFYPAAYANSISVVATDYADARAPYSNYGSTIDIAAPGGNLSVDLNGDGYGDGILQQTINGYYFFEGTSMASPHVAGVVAIMISVNGTLSNSDIKTRLYDSVVDLGAPGWDNQFGWGLVDAYEAWQNAL
jgi:serine protease